MTLKCKLFYILILGYCSLNAQNLDTMSLLFYGEGMGLSHKNTENSSLTFQSTATVFGNALTRNVITDAMGGVLSRGAVEEMLEIHKHPQTRWGLEHHSVVRFQLAQKAQKKYRQHWVFGRHDLFELEASKDFIGAALKGNAHLKGKEINSSPLNWRLLSWNGLGWGMSTQKHHKNDLFKASFTASLIHGVNAMKGDFSSVSLFTSEDISELQVTAQGNATEYPQNNAVNGWGVAVDAGILIKKRAHLFEVSMGNLGLMHYGKKTLKHQWDTTLVFNGVTWDRNRRAPVLPAWVSDSFVNNTVIVSEQGSVLMPLPTDLLLRWTIDLNRVHELGINARVRWSNVYVPQISGIHRFRCSKKMVLAQELGYGGYRNIFWDAEIIIELSKGMEFGARFFGLNTLISPIARGGNGISARLVWIPLKSRKA